MSHTHSLPHPLVMPDLIRHPVPRETWIADVETPDPIRGRNDKRDIRNDKSGLHIFEPCRLKPQNP